MINRLRKAAEEAYNTGQDVQVNPGLILALLDRQEAAEKDAARYRWMRSPIISYRAVTAMVNAVDSLCEEQMDAAIDAAMKEQK